jgi:outer membrane protein
MLQASRIGVVATLAAIAVATASEPRAETLADAIALAYQSNPNLQAQRASLRATDEVYVQAVAGFRPTASVQAQANAGNSSETFGQTVTGESTASGAVVSLTQPLYTGGRVASQVTAAQAEVLAARANLRLIEQQMLQSVVQAYCDVRRDQESVAISQQNLDLLKRQLDEAQARFEVGEITRTDVAQTESRVAAARAALSNAQAELADSRATYASVVGQNPGDLAPEPSLARFLPASVDQAYEAAEHNNPQVVQADYTEQESAAKVAAAKAQMRPTVGLQGSVGGQGGALGYSSPFANFGYAYSASVVATVPLFTGGMTTSQIRQAAEDNNVDRINIETVRRQVLLQVSKAWNALLGSRAELVANQEAVRAANIAFEGTRQEAQAGLRTTLDVLISEQDLGNAQVALVNARHDEYVASTALLEAMGALDVDDLTTGVPIYDPTRNFNEVKHAWGWSPWDSVVAAVDRAGAPSIIQRQASIPPVSAPSLPSAPSDPSAPTATAR